MPPDYLTKLREGLKVPETSYFNSLRSKLGIGEVRTPEIPQPHEPTEESKQAFQSFIKGASGLGQAVAQFPDRPIAEFLQEKGVSPTIAGLIGFIGGLATPLPSGGEFKIGKSLFHGTTRESAQKIKAEGFKIFNKTERANILGGASEFQFPKSIYFSEDKEVAELFSSGKARQIIEQNELFGNAFFLRARTEVPNFLKDKVIKKVSKKYPDIASKLKDATSYTNASKIIDNFADNFPFVDLSGEVVEATLKPDAKIYRGKEFKAKAELIKEGYDGTIFEHTKGKGIGGEYIIFNPDVLNIKNAKIKRKK